MYDDGLEIMIPTGFNMVEPIMSSQYMWISKDGNAIISVNRGNADLTCEGIDDRIEEYHKAFAQNTIGFDCKLIKKRVIYKRTYAEIRYISQMTGYDIFNMFLLGEYEDRELVVTIQCVENDARMGIRIIENITDSLKVVNNTAPEYDNVYMENDATLELVCLGRHANLVIDVDKNDFSIGREGADSIIPPDISTAVSRKHCLITKINGKYFAQDSKSSNYTLVNGVMIPPYELIELEDNDILTLADIEFRVKLNPI
jgi:hypothetical protein